MDDNNIWGNKQLLVLGVGLIAISIALALTVFFTCPKIIEIITFVSSLVSSGGVALIIIALVESRHLTKSLKNTSSDIVEYSAYNLDNKFRETFTILDNARYNGLVDILPPRQDEKRGNETIEVIAENIKTTKTIHAFSISGLDFFAFVRGPGTVAGRYFKVIQERIEEAREEEGELDLELNALLMNPDSTAARFRNQTEVLEDSQGKIEADIQVALGGISRLNNRAGKDFIKYQLYSNFPQVGFILTDFYAFVEPYHYA